MPPCAALTELTDDLQPSDHPETLNAHMSSESKDLLGLAPYGEAIKIAVEKSLETAQTFLYDLCRPAAAEAGLLFRDQVRIWRAKNLAKIVNQTQELLSVSAEGVQLKAPPRIVHEVIEQGSWCEDEHLQRMWAGLMAGSCTHDGKDESNLLFTDILKRLSSPEARLVDFACKNAVKKIGDSGYLVALPFGIAMGDILNLTGWADASVAAAHLEHLTSLGLLRAKQQFVIFTNPDDATKWKLPSATPEQLGLQFYVRCQGSLKSPTDFFGITEHV